MFSTNPNVLAVAAASAIATIGDLSALSVKGDFRTGLRLVPDFDRTENAIWGSHVTRIQGVSCITLGNGAFVTAGHLGTPRGSTGHHRVRAHDGSLCDLILFRHPDGPTNGEALSMASKIERSGREPLVVATTEAQGLALATPVTRLPKGEGGNPALLLFAPNYGLPGAATVQAGDSGGGVFQFDSQQGRWVLAGVVVSEVIPRSPSVGFREMSGSFSGAIDVSVETGVGQQLIDYRDGRLKGGGIGEFWSFKQRGAAEASVGVLLVGCAAAVGFAWRGYQARHNSNRLGNELKESDRDDGDPS